MTAREKLKEHIVEQVSRREFVKKSVTSSLGLLSLPVLAGCSSLQKTSFAGGELDSFEKALVSIKKAAPLGNHGPMAAEALVSLGRADKLKDFVPSFTGSSRDFPPSVAEINRSNWKVALGKRERITDWASFFEKETNDKDWKLVVDEWSAILAPGLRGVATHGVIRAGHAIRSFQQKESEVRKLELAEAFGYWASSYQTLPEAKDALNQKLEIPEAIEKIPVIPYEKVPDVTSVHRRLSALEGFSEFEKVTGFIDFDGDTEKIISDLTREFAKAIVKKLDASNVVTLVHIITSLVSIRNLSSVVSKETSKKLLYYGWQAAAGLYSISGQVKEGRNLQSISAKLTEKQIIEKAVNSNEVHAIKFTEACVGENRLKPDKAYLIVAEKAVDLLV